MTTAAVPAARLLDGVEALAALRPAWSSLADRCPWTTPFQRPEWLLTWARHLAAGAVWAVALGGGDDSDRLRGLAVLALYPGEDGAALPRVGLAGEGVSDHLDLLAEPEAAGDLLATVPGLLAARRDRWSTCRLDELSPASPLCRFDPPPPWRARRRPASACPALDLAPGRPLADSLPAAAWKRLAYDRRRAGREGTLAVDSAADPSAAATALDTLFALHDARWRAAGEDGVLAHPAVRAFHREVAPGFAARGALALHVLRLDGEPIAAVYGFRERDTLSYYLGGFAPDRAGLSPGWLAVGHMMEAAAAAGCRRFDFLRGEEPYKARWGARPVANVAVELALAAGRATPPASPPPRPRPSARSAPPPPPTAPR